ncbi:hypothetical protein IKE98_01570 [Candidatus Saccharibacteria bacterium]|nr:hypothetical protein [Candidatus Saccharibacteria bacterium]
MDNYLLDRETLEKIVDGIMSAKEAEAPSSQNAEEKSALREEYIKQLDDKIATAVFSSLNNQQLQEIKQLFNREDSSPESFEQFFKNAGINVEKIITDTAMDFKDEISGGINV